MNIVIASDQERDNLFAELRVDDQPWAEVILDKESGRFELTIFPSEESSELKFNLTDVEQALAEARIALEARGYHETL